MHKRPFKQEQPGETAQGVNGLPDLPFVATTFFYQIGNGSYLEAVRVFHPANIKYRGAFHAFHDFAEAFFCTANAGNGTVRFVYCDTLHAQQWRETTHLAFKRFTDPALFEWMLIGLCKSQLKGVKEIILILSSEIGKRVACDPHQPHRFHGLIQ
jgi:hypothetical protein